MDSQLHRHHGHRGYEEDPRNAALHSAVEGEGECDHHHGEKKSVLKKVKDKAKKIKDTITKHGHGHEHEHNMDEEEEDDEDEEMVDDPEVHGAPIYDSSAMRSAIGQGSTPGQTGVNLEKPTLIREDRFNTDAASGGVTSPPAPGGIAEGVGRATGREPAHTAFVRVADSPDTGRGEANMGQATVIIGKLTDLEKDPHSPGKIPTSNYQSKVADPTGTGGKEADVAPLVEQFNKMDVVDKTEQKSKPETQQGLYTGSHDQFAPQITPTSDQFTPELNTITENPESTPKSLDPGKPEDTPHNTVTGKLSYATSAIAGTAISAKNVVASKLGYGGETQEPTKTTKPISETASEYAHSVADKAISAKNVVASKLGYGGETQEPTKGGEAREPTAGGETREPTKPVSETLTEKLAPVYHKVADASTTVMSKVQGGGAQEKGGDTVGKEDVASKATDKGVSVKDYLAEKFRPGDEDKALSEAISGVLHKKRGETVKGEEVKPMGKVTESEHVARRLGTGNENRREGVDAVSAGIESKGAGVVDKIKDAFGSWLGKSNGMQTAQDSLSQSYVSNVGSENVHEQGDSGQQRLQGSSN